MDLNYVRRLIKLVTDSGIDELEIEQDNTRVRVTRSVASSAPAIMHVAASPAAAGYPAAAPSAPVAASAPADTPAAPAKAEDAYTKILSPIVGTFYRAPAPDADPYIQVGSVIAPGTPLCIIEAMKIMNEIDSETSGRVVRILVENGQAVEYNQPLFLIDPS